jgi:hypothetical protein
MALYTYTQSANFVTRTPGAPSVSDTYTLALNSNTAPPKGQWVITDGPGLSDVFQLNITLDPAGRYYGLAPYLTQYSSDGNLYMNFSDMRTNPMQVVFEGFKEQIKCTRELEC